MDHHTAVEVHVARRVGHLFPVEAIFHVEDVAGVGDVCVELAKLVVEFSVARVGSLEDALLHGKGVRVVFSERVGADFRSPTAEILAVEKRNPWGLRGGDGCTGEE